MTSLVIGQTPSQIASLSRAAVAKLAPADVSVMTTSQIAALSADQLNAMSAASLRAFQGPQVSAVSVAALSGLSTAAVAEFTQSEVASFSAAQIGSLSTEQIGAFGAAEIAALSTSQVGALSPAQIAAMGKTAIAALGFNDVKAMSNGQIAAISAAAISGLATSAIGALSTSQFAALGSAQLSGLSATQWRAISATQIGALDAAQVGGLSTTALNSLSSAQIGALSPAQTQALSNTQISSLNVTNLQALNVASLSTRQISGLLTNSLNDLSTKQEASLSQTEIQALSNNQINGLARFNLDALDVAQLSTSQIVGLTAATQAKLTSAQTALLTGADNSVAVDVDRRESDGSLTYASMLAILQDAAAGGMTATKFSGLQTLAGELNVAGGIQTSAYVQQITDDVVDGNSANAHWNGGSNTAAPLGDLSAASSQTQAQELVGKWFLGADLPATELAPNGKGYPTTYEATTLPLFAAGGPSINDVSQGVDGDCYFLAALGEQALQDPDEIKNMIQSNGNNTYSVEFQVDGKADYVTVNNETPNFASGFARQYDGSTEEFASSTTSPWVPLVEKAYVELMEQTDVTPGADFNANGNSYADISGGGGAPLTEITGKAYAADATSGRSSASLTAMLTALQSGLAAGQDVIMGTSGDATSGNLIANHMFEVTAINASTGMVSLQNPWGANSSGNGVQENFSEPIATLARDGVDFFDTTGKSMAA